MKTTRRALLAGALLAPLAAIAQLPAVEAATGDPVLINEVLASTTSTDAEYIELYGTPGASLSGLSVIIVEGDSGSPIGAIDSRVDLPAGAKVGANGFFLLASPQAVAVYGVTPDLDIPNNFIENSSTTIALVDTATISGSTVDAGIVARDALGNYDGGVGDTFFFDAPVLGPDGSFLPAGWGRTIDGVDTDTAADWTILSFNNDSPPNTPTAAAQPLVINATLVSTSSTDAEYVELFGEPGTSLSGLSVIAVESDDQVSNGAIDSRIDLGAGAAIGDNGFYLLGNTLVQTELGVTPNLEIPDNTLENSSITIALVETASITGTTAASVGVVINAVALTDGGPTDSFFFGAPVIGPDGSFLPPGARRILDGIDTGSASDWKLLAFTRNDPANVPTAGTGVGGPAEPTFIHDIQGPGTASPLDGSTVIIEGVVTGAPDPDPDSVYETFGGFYVQEENADADGNPLTSEGIFVFASGVVTVQTGDLVQVTGTVDEFGGLTEITDVSSVAVIGTAPLPTATSVVFPVASDFDFEPLEGMLVTMPQTLVVSEYFNFDRFGETVVALPTDGTDRPMIPTALYDEDSVEAAALADLNDRSRITVDDGQTSQNPSAPVHPFNRKLFSLTNAFRGGDTVTGLTGPLHYAFGLYRLMPLANGAGYAVWTPSVAPDAPDDVGGDLRVASLNALNYFLTLDDGSNTGCGPNLDLGCRGADANQPNEFARQRVKLLNTLVGLDADVIGMNEVENTTGVEALADLAAGLNARLGAGTYDFVAAGTDGAVGGDAIKVGLLYRPSAVTPYGTTAVLDTPEFIDPTASGTPRNRAAVAQTFVDNTSGEIFSVVVNHLKSKGSGCGAGDDHPLAGSCNVTRTLAAGILADWIDTDPTGVADDDWLIIGDLNSYDQEDPITTLQAAGFTDLIGQFQGEFAYSYAFDGEFGYLDYLMSSPSMTAQVTGATEWHINADEPDIFDYDTSFKSDYQDSLFDPTTPFRSSDHDAAVLGLTLDAIDAHVTANPSMAWPPNHKLRDIGFDVIVDPAGAADVYVLAATSSEADGGLSGSDVPNDIVITDGALQVRAERFNIDGRVYTATVEVSSGGQVVIVDGVQVTVPHDQRNKRGTSPS